jgi:alginate O-acetyltransferase complex protein AlgI
MFNLDLTKLADLLSYDPTDPLLFGSSLFLFFFFAFILFYRVFATSKNIRIVLILLFSLYFYYKASGIFFLLLVFSSVFNFYSGKWLFKSSGQIQKKILLICNVFINLGLLGYFKYTNFFLKILSDFQLGEFDPLNILLPIGISFYTFKSMSYVLDIYLEVMEPTNSFRDFSVFVFFFPNILAGPIDGLRSLFHKLKKKTFLYRKKMPVKQCC